MSGLRTIVTSLIESRMEGDYWDFKQKWHDDKEKLIHDIICFANTVHGKDCYIIFGINDEGEHVQLENDNRRKQSDVIDCISSTSFAGDNVPEVSVESLLINNQEIDVLIIHNSNNTPFYINKLNKKQHRLVPGYIYSREKDKNTSIKENASFKQIELLWKKRFNLTQPVLKQIENLLLNKSVWKQNEKGSYYVYNPDFYIIEEDCDLRGKEFYVYTQMNPNVTYKIIKIMNKTTVLDKYQIVLLDSGIYKTPVPQRGYFRFDVHSHK